MEHQPQGLLSDSHEMKVMKDVFLLLEGQEVTQLH